MDFKKLEYLETIYRVRSFSKAAEEHFISQPSISNAIQKLENELGVTLIDRNAKPLDFTPEGIHFMGHVQIILDAVRNAEEDMAELVHASSQEFQIAIHSTIGDQVLTKIFLDFHDKYPKCSLALIEMSNQLMLEKLITEEIDVAYTLIPDDIDLTLYETIPLQNCELHALLPKRHALEQYDRISLSMLKNERVITFPKDTLIYNKLVHEFNKLQIMPQIRTQQNIRILQNLVEQNYGISFVTVDNLSTLKDTDTFSIRPLKEHMLFLKGFILKRQKQRNPAINSLIHYAQRMIREHSAAAFTENKIG